MAMDNNAKIQHWDKLIDSGQLKGGKALDIACGTGNYSFYLARHGFEVIGVDFSEKALDIARKNSEVLGLPVTFKFADVTKIKEALPDEKFDFILDYSILHHLEPSVTADYACQCAELLKRNGKLLLVCYSDKDEFASGSTAAMGTYGNTMFYRTADEIRDAYKNLHEVFYKETRLGKRKHHTAHCFLFEKQ